MKKNKVSHAEFSAILASKTPAELVVIRRNLKAGDAPYKDAKISLVEKLLLRSYR